MTHSLQLTRVNMPYWQDPTAKQPTEASTYQEPMSREAAIQLMQSLPPEDPLHQDINRLLVLRTSGIVELNGLKINMIPENKRVLGGMLQCVSGALSVNRVSEVLSLAVLLYTISGLAVDLFQRVKNWFQGNGFRSDAQIKPTDLRAMVQNLSREDQVRIARALGLERIT